MASDEGAESAVQPRIWAECFLLCDFASVENGKLYIVGGGWERITPARLPMAFSFFLAIKLVADAALTRQPLRLRIDDVDPDADDAATPLVEYGLNVVQPADDVDAPEMALMIPLAITVSLTMAGKRRLRLVVNDQVLAFTQLRIMPPTVDSVGGADESLVNGREVEPSMVGARLADRS